jgi:hypothetical protein
MHEMSRCPSGYVGSAGSILRNAGRQFCPHHKLDFRNMNVKVNLVEKIKFDCKCWIVGARRPPASQNGLPFKFCSPLEVVGSRG